jgi:hypothetical protein
MSGAGKRRSDGVSWPVVLSLLRFNICTFSFLVVVTIPQPNLCGACMPFREMVPATWRAYDTHSLTQQDFVTTSSVKKANHRGMLLCLPL